MALHPWSGPDREEALARAADAPLDVLVVGGGITGAGVALDAASRGYRTALVEAADIGAGTSSRSTRLVHGGLRYLEQGDVALVATSVRERDRLRRMAPHLVRPLPFVLPLDSGRERRRTKAGLLAYDALTTGRRVAGHAHLDPAALAAAAPGLRHGTRHGAYRYWDCRTDDARLTLAVAQGARRLGALVANHARVTGLVPGRTGATVEVADVLGGGTVALRARWVVAAAGVAAGDVAALVPGAALAVRPARGSHLVLPAARLPLAAAVVVPSAAGDGRRVVVVPWGDQVYVGTTDVAVRDGADAAPALTEADLTYLLDALRAAFAVTLVREDVIAAWAGRRPLLEGAAAATADLPRDHLLVEGPPGVLHVTGGKLTTWRATAAEVVDRLVAGDGRSARCGTTQLRLGASGERRDGDERVRVAARRLGVGPVVASSLYHRHGDLAPLVLAACRELDGGLEPLVEGLPYLRGEVHWAARHELARTVDDVLRRRTAVALRHAAAGGREVAVQVAAVLGEVHGLGADAQAAQVDAHRSATAHERGPVPLADLTR